MCPSCSQHLTCCWGKKISDLGADGTSVTGFARPAVVTLRVNGQELTD